MSEIDLKAAAITAMANAYSPYSNFKVGAAILTKAGNVYTGCNVENISYGLSICAERNAIVQAIAAEGPAMKLKEIHITNLNENGDTGPCSPCGACRQFIAEFADSSTVVHYPGDDGDTTKTVPQLLPDGFSF